ncbi:hypothetical protein Tco_0165556, partial [Tanacetum coccineum]
QDADDEDVATKSDEDDIYKYKIHVRKDKDVEMKDVEVKGSDKGDEYIIDAEKTSEAKDDTKKTELPPSSSHFRMTVPFHFWIEYPDLPEAPEKAISPFQIVKGNSYIPYWSESPPLCNTY